MTGPGIYPHVLELSTLLYLFVKGFNKHKKRSESISNFIKGEAFFISYNNQMLLDVLSRRSLPSRTLQERPSSPLQFGQEQNIPGHLFERGAY